MPAASLRTIANTPERIKAPLKGASVHAILACALHFDLTSSSSHPENRDFVPWRDVFPSERDVRSSLPLCWDARLQSLLPHTAAGLLAKQRAKFEADLAAVQAAFPSSPSSSPGSGSDPSPAVGGGAGIEREAYLYAWLLVNTRTFYHTTPATERGKTRREDRMALQPVADLLNHSPTRGCGVFYDARGFRITARAAHAPGDEVFIQYGPHGNDFLLTEYGFVLGEGANPFDEACLDEHVLPRLRAAEARLLRREGFHGGYMLDAETSACYRTQVALRCALLPETRWRDFLDGLRPEEEDQAEVDDLLHGPVLGGLEAGVHEALARVDALGARAVDGDSRALLRERWLQIKQLIVLARHRAESS